MNIYAIIFLVITACSLLIHANKHGKPREGYYSFWIALTSCSIQIFLLYMGGFFAVIPK